MFLQVWHLQHAEEGGPDHRWRRRHGHCALLLVDARPILHQELEMVRRCVCVHACPRLDAVMISRLCLPASYPAGLSSASSCESGVVVAVVASAEDPQALLKNQDLLGTITEVRRLLLDYVPGLQVMLVTGIAIFVSCLLPRLSIFLPLSGVGLRLPAPADATDPRSDPYRGQAR